MVQKLKTIVDEKLQKSFKSKGVEVSLGYNEIENWQVLKSTSYRYLKIEVICDECEKSKFIMLKNANDLLMYTCRSCNTKGEKNPAFGKPSAQWAKINEEIKNGIRKNNFSNPEINKKAWNTKKTIGYTPAMLGKFHSSETKNKMSKTRIEKIASGEIEINANWIIRDKFYKDILYQSTYELDFLLYMESLNMLDFIKRGPVIKYDDNGKHRRYFSDFMITELNLVIEIKSTWVLDTNNMSQKESGTRKEGFNFLMILDKNYEQLNEILNAKI